MEADERITVRMKPWWVTHLAGKLGMFGNANIAIGKSQNPKKPVKFIFTEFDLERIKMGKKMRGIWSIEMPLDQARKALGALEKQLDLVEEFLPKDQKNASPTTPI